MDPEGASVGSELGMFDVVGKELGERDGPALGKVEGDSALSSTFSIR